jgi:hypothetical protein
MTALRYFHHADGHTRREPRRVASLQHRERGPRRPPTLWIHSRSPARRPWALARALRVGAEALLALWAIAALAFCAVVAVALVRWAGLY